MAVPGTLALFGALTWPAHAQVRVGTEFQVNSYTTSAQNRVSVAAYPDGFVVVWESDGQDAGNQSIFSAGAFGQRYDDSGNRIGLEWRLHEATWGSQRQPKVAAAPDGRFVTVWSEQDIGRIRGRRYDAAGSPLGPEFLVSGDTPSTTVEKLTGGVAMNSSGSFVVVWTGHGSDDHDWNVFARPFDASGSPLAGDIAVNTFTGGFQGYPSVSIDDAGRFVVVWFGHGSDDTGVDVFARRYDTSGSPAGPDFRVNSEPIGYEQYPSVSGDGSGAFVVAWHGFAGSASDEILAKRYDAFGVPLGSEFMVNTHTAQSQFRPSIAVDRSGAFMVAWSSRGPEDGDLGWGGGVLAQAFDATGSPVGSDFQVHTFTTGRQRFPALAAGGDGHFVAAWTSDYADGSHDGVFGQRFGGDVIFADGFESGDVSAWNRTSGTGVNVAPEAALAGTTAGLEVTANGAPALYVQDDSPRGERRYRARFWLDPDAFDPGEAQGHFRTRAFVAFQDAPTRRLIAVVLKRLGSQYSLMGRARRDDGSQADTGFFPIADEPHAVELSWSAASAPDANDGTLELWIDGTSVSALTGIDNDTAAVDFVRLGALSVKGGATGTLYWDEFESRRQTYIGP